MWVDILLLYLLINERVASYTLSAFLSSGSRLTAQEYGAKAGLSISNLSSSDGEISDRAARTGFTAGVFANYGDGLLRFQPELLYTQKGASYTFGDNAISRNMDYVELPLALQISVAGVYAYAGPQVSYILASAYEVRDGFDRLLFDEDESNLNRLDVGGVAGVGVRLSDITVDARVARGYINFDKDRTIDSSIDEVQNLSNFNFQFTVGIIL